MQKERSRPSKVPNSIVALSEELLYLRQGRDDDLETCLRPVEVIFRLVNPDSIKRWKDNLFPAQTNTKDSHHGPKNIIQKLKSSGHSPRSNLKGWKLDRSLRVLDSNNVMYRSGGANSTAKQVLRVTKTFDESKVATDNAGRQDEDIISAYIENKIQRNTIEGWNSCVITYGQSGTGKTDVLFGHHNRKNVLSRLVDFLYGTPSKNVLVGLSYWENF
eukprot:g3692.t1